MSGTFEEQIRELVKSGRISNVIAEALTEHYAQPRGPMKNGSGGVPSQVNLMELMNLIDLLEKKKELPKASSPAQELPSQKVRSLGSPAQFLHENKEEYLIPPETDKVGVEKKWEARVAELKRKNDKLEAELLAEQKAHAESSKMEFVYAKRYADSQEERRQGQEGEEKKRKVLEEENRKLVEEIGRIRKEGKAAEKRTVELEAVVSASRTQMQSFEGKKALYEAEIAQGGKIRDEIEKALSEEQRLRGEALKDKACLEGERDLLGGELSEKGKEAAELKSRLGEAHEAMEALRGQIVDQETALRGAHESLERLKSEKECLEKDLAKATKGLEVQGLEKDQLREALQTAGRGAELLRSEKDRLEKALEELRRSSEALSSERDCLESEKQAAVKAVAEKDVAITTLEELRVRLEKDLGVQESERVRMQGRIGELEETSEKRRVVMTSLEDDKKRLEDERQDLEKELACQEEEKLRLGKELEDRAAELAVTEQKMACLFGELEGNRSAADEALARIKELEESIMKAEAQTKEASEQCSDFEKEKDQVRQDRDEKVRMLEVLTETIRKQEVLLEEKAIVQDVLEEKLKEKEAAHAKAQAHSRGLEVTLLALEKKIDELISPPAA